MTLEERILFWFFRKYVDRQIYQGQSQSRITKMYRYIRRRAEKVYTEDNIPTLDSYLSECFEETQGKFHVD